MVNIYLEFIKDYLSGLFPENKKSNSSRNISGSSYNVISSLFSISNKNLLEETQKEKELESKV